MWVRLQPHCLPLMHSYHDQLHNQGWRAPWCPQEYPPSIGMSGEWYARLAWVVVTLKMLEVTTTSDMATILPCVPLGHLNSQVCTKLVLGPICRAKITIVERRVDYVLKRCYPL